MVTVSHDERTCEPIPKLKSRCRSSAWTLPVPRGLQFTKGQCRKWWKLTGKNTDVDGASAVRCYLENHRICRKRREGRLEDDAFIADARAPTIMNAESERNLAEEELRMILISCALEPKPVVPPSSSSGRHAAADSTREPLPYLLPAVDSRSAQKIHVMAIKRNIPSRYNVTGLHFTFRPVKPWDVPQPCPQRVHELSW